MALKKIFPMNDDHRKIVLGGETVLLKSVKTIILIADLVYDVLDNVIRKLLVQA